MDRGHAPPHAMANDVGNRTLRRRCLGVIRYDQGLVASERFIERHAGQTTRAATTLDHRSDAQRRATDGRPDDRADELRYRRTSASSDWQLAGPRGWNGRSQRERLNQHQE